MMSLRSHDPQRTKRRPAQNLKLPKTSKNVACAHPQNVDCIEKAVRHDMAYMAGIQNTVRITVENFWWTTQCKSGWAINAFAFKARQGTLVPAVTFSYPPCTCTCKNDSDTTHLIGSDVCCHICATWAPESESWCCVKGRVCQVNSLLLWHAYHNLSKFAVGKCIHMHGCQCKWCENDLHSFVNSSMLHWYYTCLNVSHLRYPAAPLTAPCKTLPQEALRRFNDKAMSKK